MKLAAAPTDLLRRVLQCSIDEGAIARERWRGSCDVMCANRPVDNVRVSGRDGIEDRLINAKVLC